MNAVDIDVSKGHSTVTVLRPFGEVVISPFEVDHTVSELKTLAKTLKRLPGETRVVMECTGNYHFPIARSLQESGIFVCTRHAGILHGYGNDTIRKDKSDSADSVKCANYCLDKWLKLTEYVPESEVRQSLKAVSRQYTKYNKIRPRLSTFHFFARLDFSGHKQFVYITRPKERRSRKMDRFCQRILAFRLRRQVIA